VKRSIGIAEGLEQRVRRLVREKLTIRPYDPEWPRRFEEERDHLRAVLPAELLGRIEHFGSTAVPGLDAKPIVDLLVEVTDLAAARERIAPVLEAEGYDYLWRPTHGDDGPPWYAWFIKRDLATGERTHHIHMVEPDFEEHWDRLLFRDRLIACPETAREYARLKRRLAEEHPRDRAAYTRGKGAFIAGVMRRAKRELGTRCEDGR
jgi:GrpB-like predicted nucleotidyltransferase (UPF0157 family)